MSSDSTESPDCKPETTGNEIKVQRWAGLGHEAAFPFHGGMASERAGLQSPLPTFKCQLRCVSSS